MINVVEDNSALKVREQDSEKLENIEFVIDTGCRKFNICSTKEILEDVRPTNTRIVGISGAPIKAEALGQLPFVGDTLYFPEADDNLISVPQLLSMYPGSTMNFTSHRMEFIGPHGTVLLTARAKYGPGSLWICTLRDLKHAATSQAFQVSPEDDGNGSESDEEM